MSDLGVSREFRLHGQVLTGSNVDAMVGYSVALSSDGTRMAVGAKEHGTGERVRVFSNLKGLWSQVGSDIVENEAGAITSVAISSNGRRIAVGASEINTIRVYDDIGGAWVKQFEYVGEDNLGTTVALSANGQVLAAGAPAAPPDTDNIPNGKVIVFEAFADIFANTPTAVLLGSQGEMLGSSLALSASGDKLVAAGMAYENSSGRANVYSRDPTDHKWSLTFRKFLAEAVPGQEFGVSLAISPNGTRIACGGKGDIGLSGRVQVFDASTSDVVLDVVAPFDNEDFGISVTLSDMELAVGSPDPTEDNASKGHVYLYNLDAEVPSAPVQVIAPRLDVSDSLSEVTMFGFSVALSADGLVLSVGAPEYLDSTGRVRVYRKAAFAVNPEQAFEKVLVKQLEVEDEVLIGSRALIRTTRATLVSGAYEAEVSAFSTDTVRSVKFLVTAEAQVTDLTALHSAGEVATSSTNTVMGSTTPLLECDCVVSGNTLKLLVTNTSSAEETITVVATATLK